MKERAVPEGTRVASMAKRHTSMSQQSRHAATQEAEAASTMGQSIKVSTRRQDGTRWSSPRLGTPSRLPPWTDGQLQTFHNCIVC